MRSVANLWPVLLVCAFLALDATEGSSRQDALKAFQPLKAPNAARGQQQQRRLIAGASELFVSIQSELILTQEPYVQEAIDEEANILERLTAPAINTDCAQFVQSRTDLLMRLAGLSLRNCVAKIDDEMFTRFYPSSQDEYAKISLLSSFRDGNIFIDPVAIQASIVEKLNNANGVEGVVVTSEQVAALKSAFVVCLAESRAIVKESLDIGVSQVDAYCAN